MLIPVGVRFCPTDSEIVDHYLRLKNLGETLSHFDKIMSTLKIYSFDPWDLPFQSRIKSGDKVWHFFSHKEKKYQRGVRQNRKTKSGYWKKTGVTMNIMRKSYGRSLREKIGEKRVLVFHLYKNLGGSKTKKKKNLGGSKTDWVMHEYHSVSSSPTQMGTYSICKVHFKGKPSDMSSSGSDINMNTSELTSAYEGSPLDRLHNQDLQNPSPLDDVLDVEQETQLEDAIHKALNNLSSHDWKGLLDICNNSKP